jgi:Domain of unknown function (DUF4055)
LIQAGIPVPEGLAEMTVELAPLEDHPDSDPTCPSYQSEHYKAKKDDLDFILDMFIGNAAWVSRSGEITDKGKANNHLPQYSEEPKEEYEMRIKLSPFEHYFEPAVTDYPGLLCELEPSSRVFKGLTDAWKDIDGQGNDLPTFFLEADKLVLRDGFMGVLVEMPTLDNQDVPPILTDTDITTYPIRPYLVGIERKDIINWSYTTLNGKLRFKRVTIRQWVTDEDGLFGELTYCQYKVFLGDGSCSTYVLVKIQDEVFSVLISQSQNSLGRIPITLYSIRAEKPFQSEPLLIRLADANREYYRLYSEYRDAIRKVNCPVPVRSGLIVPGQTDFEDVPPIVIGSNTGIDVPSDGDFKFAEPTGNALQTTRSELDRMVTQMERHSLSLISGDGANSYRTAEEVKHRATRVQNTLSGLATQKESVIDQIDEDWRAYYNKKPIPSQKEPTVKVNRELLKDPISPNEMIAISTLAEKHQISKLTALKMFREGKRIPKDTNIEEELKLIEEDIEAAIKLLPTTNANPVKKVGNPDVQPTANSKSQK